MLVSLSGRLPAAQEPGHVSPGIIGQHRDRHMRGVARMTAAIDQMGAAC